MAKKVKKVKKAIEKVVKVEKSVAKVQRYVANRNVDLRKAEGWKVVGGKPVSHGRTMGVKTSALGESRYEAGKEPQPASDLILMEK